MSKNKFYVVWNGHKPGIYSSWDACRKQVEGVKDARYKGFPDKHTADAAYKMGPENYKNSSAVELAVAKGGNPPIGNSIAVDAACAGNPGKMEYRGVLTETNTELFHSKLYALGTNNIGEFLAIVHALAWQQQKKFELPIYSDSVNAINWVKAGKARTKLVQSPKNEELFEHIARAEKWLKNNPIHVPLLKWKTNIWGEIPADFGRK
jgi:ribonuclease HI